MSADVQVRVFGREVSCWNKRPLDPPKFCPLFSKCFTAPLIMNGCASRHEFWMHHSLNLPENWAQRRKVQLPFAYECRWKSVSPHGVVFVLTNLCYTEHKSERFSCSRSLKCCPPLLRERRDELMAKFSFYFCVCSLKRIGSIIYQHLFLKLYFLVHCVSHFDGACVCVCVRARGGSGNHQTAKGGLSAFKFSAKLRHFDW